MSELDLHLMKLVESFTTVLPYEVVNNSSDLKRYQFQFEDVTFIMEFKYKHENTGTTAIVAFYAINEYGQMNPDQTFKHKSGLQLFSTITKIITDSANSWDILCFVNEPNRFGLYSLIVKRFAKQYEVFCQRTEIGDVWFISKEKLPEEVRPIIAKYASRILRDKSGD